MEKNIYYSFFAIKKGRLKRPFYNSQIYSSVWHAHCVFESLLQFPLHLPLFGQVAAAGQPIHFTPRFFSLTMYATAAPTIAITIRITMKFVIPIPLILMLSLIHIQLPFSYSYSELSIPKHQPLLQLQ